MPRPEEKTLFDALCRFAEPVSSKMNAVTAGEPEDQLRAPFEVFMEETGRGLAQQIVCTGETKLAGRLGKPDYAVHAGKLLAGFVELKATGTGENPNRFSATTPGSGNDSKPFPI